MKKTVSIFVLAFCVLSLHAQNWQPFVKNQTNYYKQQEGNSITVESFTFDSIQNKKQGQKWLFNSKINLSQECISSIKGFISSFSLLNDYKIDSLTTQHDSVLFITYNKYFNADTFIFKPYCKVGDKWKTNTIEITCTKEEKADLLGVTDSIKTFTCSGKAFNQIIFKLSKSNGFIQFIPLIDFIKQPETLHPYYELIGYKNKTIRKAYNQPDFSDYFHLKKGDVLFWEKTASLQDNSFFSDSITQVFSSIDSVNYSIKRTYFDATGNFTATENTSQHYTRKSTGSYLSNSTSYIRTNYQQNNDNQDITYLYPLLLEIENNDTITYATIKKLGIYINTNTCQASALTGNRNAEYDLSTREGMIRSTSNVWDLTANETLIGSIIEGKKRGTTQIIPQIKDDLKTNQSERIQIYPNPVTDYLSINTKQPLASIEIFSIQGTCLIKTANTKTIDVKGIPSGIYILKIKGRNGILHEFKFIKK